MPSVITHAAVAVAGGIAFAPRDVPHHFKNKRFFFSWTPIKVSPIRVKAFFSKWGWSVFKSELLWIWLPFFMITVLARIIRIVAVRH